MTLGFLSAPRTFAISFVFPVKFLYCTNTTGSIEYASPAPRLHIDDCCLIHFLGILWSAVFRNSVTHKILSEFLRPFRYVRTQRVAPYLIVILIFILFSDFGWFIQQPFWCFRRIWVSPYLSIHTFTWHDCWESDLNDRSPLKMSWVFEVDEVKEDLEWSISCLKGVMGVEEGKTGGRTRWQTRNHDWYEVFRVALYPNTV